LGITALAKHKLDYSVIEEKRLCVFFAIAI